MTTITTTTTQLPPGIYRIATPPASIDPGYLTRKDGLTISKPGVQPGPEEEWRIIPGKGGNIIIEVPRDLFPASYLTYEGAPETPKEGEAIKLVVSEFPLNEWQLSIAPGFASLIRVAGSELGIKVFPIMPPIFPPPPVRLILGAEQQVEWRFEFVR